jgi:hypothetical protein
MISALSTTTFGLSLSKACLFPSGYGKEEQGFDKLSPNGAGVEGDAR